MSSIHQLLQKSKRIVVLTGAGVSTDSGIPDFKSTDEMWPYSEPRERLISTAYFQQDPWKFWEAYRTAFGRKNDARPNRFHHFVASLEAEHHVTVVTQNVDGLHQAAGSTRVLEAHGTLKQAVCLRGGCGEKYSMEDLATEEKPRCKRCNKVLKPDVVLFGEMPRRLDEAADAILLADLLIVAGTALDVAPVSELPYIAQFRTEKPMVWLNREFPPYSYDFTHRFIGELSTFLAELPSGRI
jgi:NAD-dependent SIR2 family protein deacetylase